MSLYALPERLSSRIAVDPAGCWRWQGVINHGGYGLIGNQRVHRLTYETLVGPIPQGLDLDHLCRIRDCVNPSHLEPVTRGVNTLRGETLAAAKASQTHCIHGHALTGDNVYLHPKRRTRNCRACMTDNSRRRRQGATGVACSTDGCVAPGVSRGMCASHYMRWWRSQPGYVRKR